MATASLDDARRRALYARIARRYPLRVRPFAVSDLRLDILTVSDPDRVLLEMEQGVARTGVDDPRWQPYWAQAWLSAEVLGRAIAARDLGNLQVLDLGCGVGLAGVVAAARGATVVFADAAPPALLFARWNAWPWRRQVRVQRVDWCRDRLGTSSFDLILGADILYDRHDWPYLGEFWREHLARQGEVRLVEPGRSISDGFQQWAEGSGWWVERQMVEIAGQRRPYRAYCLRDGTR